MIPRSSASEKKKKSQILESSRKLHLIKNVIGSGNFNQKKFEVNTAIFCVK